MKTYLAPTNRSAEKEIKRQNRQLISSTLLNEISAASNTYFMILNANRQIVYTNKQLLELLNINESAVVYGNRLGEALHCINSDIMEAGCGTSEQCIHCGAVNAILSAIAGIESEKECRVSTKEGQSIDLSVKTKPFYYEDDKYVLLFAVDISDKKRREVLERTFFHDIMNTIGGLKGMTELLTMEISDNQKESIDIIYNLSDRLVHEIQSHRMLLNAENDKLKLELTEINLALYLQEIKLIVHKNKNIKHTKIDIISDEALYFQTDIALLQRILINMIKNAAEASDPEQTITIKAFQQQNNGVISIHNESYMPKDVQLQIFQRSFSTKGTGRGVGTYSMKLFAEKYLCGKIYFTSSKEEGTTFYFEHPINLETKSKETKNGIGELA